MQIHSTKVFQILNLKLTFEKYTKFDANVGTRYKHGGLKHNSNVKIHLADQNLLNALGVFDLFTE